MNDLRSEIEVIRTRYLELALTTKDLQGQQVMLQDELGDETNPAGGARLRKARRSRDKLLADVIATLESMRDLPRKHGEATRRTLDRCLGIRRTIAQLEEPYRTLLALPASKRPHEGDPP